MPEIRPLNHLVGAEVAGVDLKSLGDNDFARIYDAFLQHIVLVFRDQDLTMEDFIAHGRRYGTLRPHIVQKSRHPELPELMVMDNKIVDTKKGVEEKSVGQFGQARRGLAHRHLVRLCHRQGDAALRPRHSQHRR